MYFNIKTHFPLKAVISELQFLSLYESNIIGNEMKPHLLAICFPIQIVQ